MLPSSYDTAIQSELHVAAAHKSVTGMTAKRRCCSLTQCKAELTKQHTSRFATVQHPLYSASCQGCMARLTQAHSIQQQGKSAHSTNRGTIERKLRERSGQTGSTTSDGLLGHRGEPRVPPLHCDHMRRHVPRVVMRDVLCCVL
jgi:hypothetical protein